MAATNCAIIPSEAITFTRAGKRGRTSYVYAYLRFWGWFNNNGNCIWPIQWLSCRQTCSELFLIGSFLVYHRCWWMTKSFLRAQRLRVNIYTAANTHWSGLGSSCTGSSESAIDPFGDHSQTVCMYLYDCILVTLFHKAKTTGCFCHCVYSHRCIHVNITLPSPLNRYSHELNLAATESAFTIVPYFCPKEDMEKTDVLTVSAYCTRYSTCWCHYNLKLYKTVHAPVL